MPPDPAGPARVPRLLPPANNCAPRAGNGRPATQPPNTNHNTNRDPAKFAEQQHKSTTQVNSMPANRTGQTRTPASLNIPRNNGQSSFKFARDPSCNKFGIFLCELKACYRHEHCQTPQPDAIFRNLSLPLVASPIPHPCTLAPSPPRHAAPVTLPPTHHIWFSLTGPGPSVT